MATTNEIINKHCEKANIPPEGLFRSLLSCLFHDHVFGSTGRGFAKDANNRASVFDEINLTAKALGKKEGYTPPSILAAIDLPVEYQHWLRVQDAEGKKGKQPQEAALLEREAKALQTIRLIIRDMLNQGETASLENRLDLEEIAEKEGESTLPDLNMIGPATFPPESEDEPEEPEEPKPE